MRTKKYTTLKGLIHQTRDGQVNLYDVKNRQMCLKHGGWCKVEFSEELYNEMYEKFAKAIYSSPAKVKECAERLPRVANAGIFKRVILTGYQSDGQYCVGQDYDSEIRLIQRLTYK